MWTTPSGVSFESAHYVKLEYILFTDYEPPYVPTYAESSRTSEERYNSQRSCDYVNPWLAGRFEPVRRESCLQTYINPWLAGKNRVQQVSQPAKRTNKHKGVWAAKNRRWRDYFQKKERHSAVYNFEPQKGLECMKIHNIVSDLAKLANVDYTDELVVQLEGVVFLLFNLQGCQDYVAMSSAILLYMRKFFDKSLTSHVMGYVSELFETEPQSGSEKKEDVVKSKDWVTIMRNLRTNWSLVKENKLFTHFSKLLGLIVVMELCKASDLTFTIKDYKVWEPDMKLVHSSAYDIFDAALMTVTFFVERLSLCWKERSLRPLILHDESAAKLDEEYAIIVGWWDLVKNGNLKRTNGISDHEFDNRLEALTTRIRELLPTLKSFDKKLMNDKFIKLLNIKNDYVTKKICSGMRKAPFCIELFGESSMGKSTFGEQTMCVLLTSQDLPTGKEFQSTYNASDKYMSNWTTDKIVLLVDDIANEKSDFVERPPTRIIIDVANNTPMYANMADIDSKGKVFVEPEIMLVTTNVKDLDARIYSNCPYSVQRRMHVVITVVAKPEFQIFEDGIAQGIDSDKVDEYNAAHPDAVFDDIWTLTLERAVKPEKLTSTATYKPIEHNGKVMKNVSFREAQQYLVERFEKHCEQQENILKRMMKRRDVRKCGHDGCKQIHGLCDLHDHLPLYDVDVINEEEFEDTFYEDPDTGELVDRFEELEEQFGDEIIESVQNAGSMITDRIRKDIFGLERSVEGACTFAIMGAAQLFYRYWDWMTIVPTPWLENHYFMNFMLFLHKNNLRNSYMRKTCILWLVIAGCAWWTHFQPESRRYPLYAALLIIGLTVQKSMVNLVRREFSRQLVDRNTIAPVLQNIRDEHINNICKACTIVGALYAVARVYRAWKKISPQGSLEPKTEEDIRRRDAETNVWTSVVPRELPTNPLTANTTSDQLLGLVEKNLVYGSVVIGEKVLRVNGLFLTSNIVVIPNHYFEVPVLDVTFRKSNPESSGGKFAVRLSISQSVLLPDSDIRICYSCSGGSFKDLRKYLPTDDIPFVEFALRWRDKSGEVERASGVATLQQTGNGAAEFKGLYYQSLTMDTFRGMCGAVLVAKRKPILLGVHLGGRTGTPKGCAGILPAHQVSQAIDELCKIEGVLITGSAEKFETQVLGINIITGNQLHPKSPLNFMPEDSQVEFYGTCPGMSMFKSEVKVTPISTIVTEVTGEPNIYRPPIEEPQYYGWQKCLENLAIPATPYSPDLLILAIKDYKSDLIPIFQSKLWRGAKPLNDKENLCGIPGLKFVDAIKLNTSIGYPLGGSKRRFIVELPPTPDKPNNRVFDDVIMDEIERCLDCYKRGERAYVIARACKKDEVLAKAKCRIFYGNGIALTFLVRKYFLPILRVMQFNPKVSECAVGVNCHGPEWQELHEHIYTFGEDRLIGGDYGKYDQKIPSQLILASLRIMIDFARECDYEEEDLRVMEALAGDIVYAIIAFNGDLIGLTEGTHISGNSLTVIINGICGALNLRCFFYAMNPCADFERRLKFREYVKLITYGDDNIGSVSPEIDNFTIKGISEFLAVYGQIYTMPDKESELLDFLPAEDFEFLKRSSVYNPDLGMHIGALADKSIFKMLHCYLRGKNAPLTEEHMCAQNIDTALREWFNHGRDVYETRRAQMNEIAARANIVHLCAELETTYDMGVERWKAKYIDGYCDDSHDVEIEIFGDL